MGTSHTNTHGHSTFSMCIVSLHGEEQLTAAGLALVQETGEGRRGQLFRSLSAPVHPPATLVHKKAVVADPNLEGFGTTPKHVN